MRLHTVLALGVLVIFGVIRQPLEQSIASDLKANHFREADTLNLSMRERLGQLGAAAALGGFRSFLATIFEMRAQTAWSDVDWDKVEFYYNIVTQLQPRETSYWDSAGWMLATNASSYYLNTEFFTLEELKRFPDVELEVLADTAKARGKQFLHDGLAYNPNDYLLNRSLAQHYVNKEEDFCQAAEYFQKAADSEEGPTLAKRHAALYLAWCPGREHEAYEALLEVYHNFKAPFVRARLEIEIRYLEEILKVPTVQRIPIEPNLDLERLYRIRIRDYGRAGPKKKASLVLLLKRLEVLLKIPQERRIPDQLPLRSNEGDAK